MKRFLILASAVAMVFTACNNNTGGAGENASSADSTSVDRREAGGMIAYVNIDTLMNRYDMYKDMSSALEAKASKAQKDLTAQGRNLERALADAQEKFDKGLITRSQGVELQEKLQRQQQNFLQQQEKLENELAEENQVMVRNLYYSLDNYLKEFNSDYKYRAILATSATGPVLHADPQLDITDMIVKGLNEKYALEKNTPKDTGTAK